MAVPEQVFSAPRGMRDFYPEDMVVRDLVFEAWRRSARKYGFQPYDACVVESLELLKRKSGEEIVEQIYSFQDKSGRDLALRPEVTPTLARMVAARQAALTFPIRWSTIAQCFRYERMSRGRKREHYQWNLDIIGEPSVSAEAEILAAAVDALYAMGLEPGTFRVLFSSRAMLAEILEKLGIPAGNHAALFLALDKWTKIGDTAVADMLAASGLEEQCVSRILELVRMSSLEEVGRLLGEDSPALRDVRSFLSLLEPYGIQDVVRFDLSVVRGLAYYTGLVFEAFDSERRLRAIFGGGRYDDLLGQVGGKPTSGVGLGFGDVVIAELLADRGVDPRRSQGVRTAVGFMEEGQRAAAVKLAAFLRQRGDDVELGLAPEKAKRFFTRSGKGRFTHAAYIGPDDVAGGRARVKDLASRAEDEIDLAAL